jgi:hypothetical protein
MQLHEKPSDMQRNSPARGSALQKAPASLAELMAKATGELANAVLYFVLLKLRIISTIESIPID